jgi:hypothetical protein
VLVLTSKTSRTKNIYVVGFLKSKGFCDVQYGFDVELGFRIFIPTAIQR